MDLTNEQLCQAFRFAYTELYNNVWDDINEAIKDGTVSDFVPVVYELWMRLATDLLDVGWKKEELLRDLSQSLDNDIKALHIAECSGRA